MFMDVYADIFAKDIDFGDEVEFLDLKVKIILLSLVYLRSVARRYGLSHCISTI